MKNVIITGTNGMIGKLVLENCLNSSNVNKITSVTRRPTGIKHEKLVEVFHDDFIDFSKIEEHLKNQDVCFYCLGVYTGTVSIDEFKTITVGYTKAFGAALKRESGNITFCFLSGQSADTSEKSLVLFAREKGIAENYLLALNFSKTYIFRPGYIYPVTPRKEPNFLYKFMRLIYKPLSVIYPGGVVTSTKLAEKMVIVVLNGVTKFIMTTKT